MSEELPKIDPNTADRVIATAIDETRKEADDNLIRLSTGVVLKAKQANPNILIRVMTKMQRPAPPLWKDPTMGREMENPNDPDYISRVQAWQMDYSNAMLNVLIGLGTELVSKPSAMEGPHDRNGILDPQWIRDYQSLGLPTIPDSASWRYITWVMFKAAPTEKDVALITDSVKNLSGVKEADVRDAETFPKSN